MQPSYITTSYIRRIFAVAGMLAVFAVACFWLACTARLEPLGSGAVSLAASGGDAVLSSVHAEQGHTVGAAVSEDGDQGAPLTPEILKASVDSLAVSMGGVFASLPDAAARRAAIQGALDTMSFQPGAVVHYTAWEGTTLLHSPLTPDTADMDFQSAQDIDGAKFMHHVAEQADEGGFVSLVLPPARGAARPPHHQQVYARSIPQSSWYIAAFMQAPAPEEAARFQGAQGQGDAAPTRSLRLGFLALALSLAGLAALLVVHARAQSSRCASPLGGAPA